MPNHRTPRNLKVLRGTDRADRVQRKTNQQATGVPEMPEGFGDDFAAAWKHHVELMEPLRVLVPADCFALEALVHAHLDLRRAQAAVAEDGAFYMHGKLQKKHPACAIAADADRRYMSWLAKFGLTPVDRERVSPVPEERPPSPWAEFAEAD